ncbi:MAG: hypothetical protein WC879_00620 [Melioribacteraceae bacterium]
MKKLVALLVLVAFSASIYAQAQPQKKAVAPKAKTETVKPVEMKAEPKAAAPKAEKKSMKKAAPKAEKKAAASKAEKKAELKKEVKK